MIDRLHHNSPNGYGMPPKKRRPHVNGAAFSPRSGKTVAWTVVINHSMCYHGRDKSTSPSPKG